ncbi:hypothetical protein [Microbacterium album]|uniref:Adenylate kinase n=1 Tax=Microbacterium album TaxID=2053191 RepID=A0A917IDS2_9MICO|nr:hypothetical protein [Microbacterium album]GGH39190.1 adenylate kinase [Microbacterium album]
MSSRSSTSDSPFVLAHEAACTAVIAAVAALPPGPAIVLLDGRSGSGKSTMAARLVAEWPRPGERPQLVALDSLYPGWRGLAEGTRLVREWVLEPHRSGRPGRWRRFDWIEARFAEAHDVDPARPLVVEGAGALTPASSALADVTVWVDAPEPSRRGRALARDGEAYEPHWDVWAGQEARHIARNDPRGLAQLAFELP